MTADDIPMVDLTTENGFKLVNPSNPIYLIVWNLHRDVWGGRHEDNYKIVPFEYKNGIVTNIGSSRRRRTYNPSHIYICASNNKDLSKVRSMTTDTNVLFTEDERVNKFLNFDGLYSGIRKSMSISHIQ